MMGAGRSVAAPDPVWPIGTGTMVAFRPTGWPCRATEDGYPGLKTCGQIALRPVVCRAVAVWRVEEHANNVRTMGFYCIDHLDERFLAAQPLLEHARRRFVRAHFLRRHAAATWFR
jgi:hypothetical protein